MHPPTLILRHRKENLKKCSLRGLEKRSDMRFFTYPLEEPLPSLQGYVVLALEAPPLSEKDKDAGLLLIDGTWRYSLKMLKSLREPFEKRSLPSRYRTAYPRTQQDCPDPERGLASVEALYLAYALLDRETSGLLDHYHWKETFLNSLDEIPNHAHAQVKHRGQDDFLEI